MVHYRSFHTYAKECFGRKLYKLSLNGGMTCPNRDGTCGDRGCIFCSAGGSGDFAAPPQLSVSQQIEYAKKQIADKCRAKDIGYIAYFQAYTNTYAPVHQLRSLFYEAILHPDICVLSIGTRPDCLPEDVLALLEELNRIKPVWIELGLQTVKERSAELIRRGYPLEVFDQAMESLRIRGIETIVHVILGLPGETLEDMKETVRYVAASGAAGIKLQLLHVLKGTDLYEMYQKDPFPLPTLSEYLDILEECLRLLPEDMVVHRLTGDGPRKLLAAPEWSADKKRVLNAIRRRFPQ